MMTETEQKQTMDNTEKGITIALIDDAVDETFRRQCGMDYIDFTGEPETHQYGHASVCARLILNRCPAAKIINLRVLKDGWTANDTGAFRKALQYCLENDVAVISMSIGTTDLNEQKGLVPLLKALHSQGKIMIAAIQNEDKVSLPASLPYVTGVKADHACLLEEGTFVKCKANPPGIDIVMSIMGASLCPGIFQLQQLCGGIIYGIYRKKKRTTELEYARRKQTIL